MARASRTCSAPTGSSGWITKTGKLVPISCGERLSLISIESFLEDKDAAIIWRGPKKVGAIQQFVADVKWGALDYLAHRFPSRNR